jgi:pimeloyl-ACP methyl ester carboxylesterase
MFTPKIRSRDLLILLACLMTFSPSLFSEPSNAVAALTAPSVDKTSQPTPAPFWSGYSKQDFTIDGHKAILIEPKTPLPGKPWIWRTEFFGHEPQADVALLAKGYHVAFINVQDLYGAPVALRQMEKFHDYLVKNFGLSPKPVMEGFSRGGLYAFNWAACHPDEVTALYVDAPVCDFKSWPAGKGKSKPWPKEWEGCKKVYGLTEEQAMTYSLNPVDNLKPLASAHIPILAVCGDADNIVPIDENILVVEKRYKELGGEIKVISKPGCGHHPHSLVDPTPIVDFILSHQH